MSENLFKLFTTQFSTALDIKLQQQGSKLRGKVREGSHTGKQASPIQYAGAIQAQAPAGRFAPKNRQDADFERRWVFPNPKDVNQLIDEFDQLETINDPQSQLVTDAAYAIGRAWDDAIIAAAFGSASIGVDPTAFTTETFDTTKYRVASTFGASAATGLTVAKLIEAKRIFRHNHVDLEMDPATIVIGSQQESDLLNQAQVVSTDFNDKPVLVDGRVTRFMGFDIVVMERLTVVSSVRQCIAFVKSGMYLGMWRDLKNTISYRNDLSSEPVQIYTQTMFGATRLEAGRVVQVLCADTTGADITP